MKRVTAVFLHVDLSVYGYERSRVGVITIRNDIVDIKFRSALQYCAIPAPYLNGSYAVLYGI